MKKIDRYSHFIKLHNVSKIKIGADKIKAVVRYIKQAQIYYHPFDNIYWAFDCQIEPFEVTNIRYSSNGNNKVNATLLKAI